jgi:hypothetical protein
LKTLEEAFSGTEISPIDSAVLSTVVTAQNSSDSLLLKEPPTSLQSNDSWANFSTMEFQSNTSSKAE